MVRDANGKVVPLWLPTIAPFGDPPHPTDHTANKQRKRAIRANLQPGDLTLVWIQVIGLVLILTGFTLALSANPGRGWGWPVALVTFSILSTAVAWRGVIAKRADGIARTILQGRRCASCGYDLSGLPADADSKTICPECAAAWKIPTD